VSRKHLVTFISVVFVAALAVLARGAGKDATEEAAIRTLIAAYDDNAQAGAVPHLADQIFWSSAFKRPVMGSEKGVPVANSTSAPDRVPGSQRSRTEPLKIVISDSHDLAYEYSKSNLQFDMKSGQHIRLETGQLRIWQKEGGEWKIAAMFSRRFDE
jgi:ketosteroid isomerase-like protein